MKVKRRELFIAKVGRIGIKSAPSYFIVIPKAFCRIHNITFGDIIQLEFVRKVGFERYGLLNGFSSDKQVEQIRKKIERMELPQLHKHLALEETKYLLSILSRKSKIHTPPKSIASVAIYVAGVNLYSKDINGYDKNYRRLTQREIGDFYGISTVTIRKHLKKGWFWSDNLQFVRKHLNPK